MWHQSQDIPSYVQDAGDVLRRAIWIRISGPFAFGIDVSEGDSFSVLKHFEGVAIADEPAFAVGYRDFQDLIDSPGPKAHMVLGAQVDDFADELLALVKEQRSRQQSSLAEDLESIADADDGTPFFGKAFDLGHDGGSTCHGAAPEVVAKAETTRDEDRVEASKAGGFIPDIIRADSDILTKGIEGILVAVRTWELKDGDSQTPTVSFTISNR